ncbi:MAG: hypothetical protein F2681_02415 [Actinobacteria bacterium]|uniref:Unannotated protein n=1 Tax=freshwater metagenome TaxID=449393 RepID=A0A6J7H643_9ZZZZ|nr:hypothetical protein [Actinomycetota bacterium]MSW76268.1 hypothetical protein [Actinomycetota bacterium]MSX92176.1 hypothetical protein [Actinomycetota bacterium]MSZ81978.1 hypothetical protein [Actinomycetota bacterium]MTB16817.1 hypothetical protein [Actinomycetota bacterium]
MRERNTEEGETAAIDPFWRLAWSDTCAYAQDVRTRTVSLIVLIALAATACGAADSGVTATRARKGAGGGIITGDTTNGPQKDYPIIDGVVDFGERGPVHPEYDGFLTAAFADIQSFWATAYPDTYSTAWTPLSGGIYAAYPDREAEIPGCGGGTTSSYNDVATRGAFYCPVTDFMAYDDDGLLPSLVDSLGREAVAIVLAHEFGHAVQNRAGEGSQRVVLKEQQADCFAGAWSAHVAAGASDTIRFDDKAVRAGLVAMLSISDPLLSDGTNPLDVQDAHGTGFDRVGAFQDGYEGGVQRCKTFFTEDRLSKLIDIPFDPNDPNAGNLPLVDPNPDPTNGANDIVTVIPAGLDEFWVALTKDNSITFTPPTYSAYSANGPFPTCSGIDAAAWKSNVIYCVGDNTIYWDQDYALRLSSDPHFGDMSVGYLFSGAYGEAIQVVLKSTASGENRALGNDCLTGAWVASILPPATDKKIVLSAGDLDEAVSTMIALSDPSTDTNVVGSAFEKVSAFRKGVLGGLAACQG